MLGSAFLAAIIPFFMWLYQKVTKTNSPEKQNLNFLVFVVLFAVLSIWDIVSLIITYSNAVQDYGNNVPQVFTNRIVSRLIVYGVVFLPIIFRGTKFKQSDKFTIIEQFKNIFKNLNQNNLQRNSNKQEFRGSYTNSNPYNKSPRKTKSVTKTERLYCPSCYAEVNQEDIFCGECGFKLIVEEETETTPIEKINPAKQTKLVKEKVNKIKEKVKEKVKEIKSPPQTSSTKDRLKEYKQLFEEGLISEEEYTALKKKALNL